MKLDYNKTNICDECGTNLIPGKSHREYIDNKFSGKVLCIRCGNKSRHNNDYKYRYNSQNNIRKSLRNRRTGNLRQDSEQAKGDLGEELLCEWKRFTNLNKKYDNYEYPIDCLDEDTGLYYQVKIAYYNPVDRYWHQSFKHEHNSIRRHFRFKSLFLFCIDKKGKIVERIYEISEEDVIKREIIAIVKNSSRITWYEDYRIKDEKTLESVNKIWQKINDKK